MEDDKKKPVTPVPAATVLLIRDTDQGLEVFMVERNNRMHFASALVFPGGLVDPEDSEESTTSLSSLPSDQDPRDSPEG